MGNRDGRKLPLERDKRDLKDEAVKLTRSRLEWRIQRIPKDSGSTGAKTGGKGQKTLLNPRAPRIPISYTGNILGVTPSMAGASPSPPPNARFRLDTEEKEKREKEEKEDREWIPAFPLRIPGWKLWEEQHPGSSEHSPCSALPMDAEIPAPNSPGAQENAGIPPSPSALDNPTLGLFRTPLWGWRRLGMSRWEEFRNPRQSLSQLLPLPNSSPSLVLSGNAEAGSPTQPSIP